LTIPAAYWLYGVLALGAVAVHTLLPRAEPRRNGLGFLIGGAALIAFLVFLAWRVVIPDSRSESFYWFGGVALAASVRVISHTKPVYSALYFVLVILAVACLLVLLEAEFLAVALIIIYAGAILVTYLFVIMLAQQSGAPVYDRRAREPLWAVAAGFALLAGISGQAVERSEASPRTGSQALSTIDSEAVSAPTGNTAAVGIALMTRYITATELAAVLLLISMVGAIALSKKRAVSESTSKSVVESLGQVGREVKPF
jgi:NADH-quinone oxidoreductase subunit J